jgi:hypothetical protein
MFFTSFFRYPNKNSVFMVNGVINKFTEGFVVLGGNALVNMRSDFVTELIRK